MKRNRFSKVFFWAIAAAIGFSSCKSNDVEEKKVVQPVKIYQVSTNHNKASKKVFTGLVKESREVKLAFQVPGSLVKLVVNEGQFVSRGALIAVLDDRDYKVQLDAANANYDNAKLQADRYAALYEKRSTSKSIYDQMQAAYKAAKASKEAAENALKDTRIYAPFSGYIQTKYAENYEKIAVGHPVVSIIDVANLEVTVALSENDFLQRERFASFNCRFESFQEEEIALQLIEIEHKPNRDNFFKMRLKIDAKDKRIVPGMVANITAFLSNSDTQTVKVPVESVFSKKSKSYVWLYKPSTNKVHQQNVVLGKFDSKGMVSIQKGLSVNDFVVSAGVHSLEEGQTVKSMNQKSNSNIGGQL